ncbi:methionine ABC transporter ATP-binding protein [Fictibacillus enclensis]|uniref:methionine ABC transporter ATP-binding protein n=1 Tax=Fictibacillus enclensis TaxID=1017270 RepID=UPI0025A2E424|nr:methionine ABC transporter ATP-binding protein [Fictibacillus enclensis]MDM5337019.1 methionine ABC transporter ATP-binding protein [Fictibacillus enclensis]
MIRFEEVTKIYESGKNQVKALNNVSFEIDKGEIYGVVGYSGAGKSSLLRCVNLLEKPSSGRVLVDGENMADLSPKELRKKRKNIGMIFQHFNLLNAKTVFDNIATPLYLQGEKKSVIKEKVNNLLEFVGLSEHGHKYPDQLSGGQKQRVGIARALSTDPEVLLCDEATSALDPQTTSSILKLLKKINKEYHITILIITHEMNVIREICSSVAVMEKGKVIEKGSVFEVFSRPKTETARRFVSSVLQDELPDSLKTILRNQDKNHQVFRIVFTGASTGQPLLSQIAKKFDVDVSVLYGHVTELQDVPFGNLVVQLIGDELEIRRAVFFAGQGDVEVREVIEHAS